MWCDGVLTASPTREHPLCPTVPQRKHSPAAEGYPLDPSGCRTLGLSKQSRAGKDAVRVTRRLTQQQSLKTLTKSPNKHANLPARHVSTDGPPVMPRVIPTRTDLPRIMPSSRPSSCSSSVSTPSASESSCRSPDLLKRSPRRSTSPTTSAVPLRLRPDAVPLLARPRRPQRPVRTTPVLLVSLAGAAPTTSSWGSPQPDDPLHRPHSSPRITGANLWRSPHSSIADVSNGENRASKHFGMMHSVFRIGFVIGP